MTPTTEQMPDAEPSLAAQFGRLIGNRILALIDQEMPDLHPTYGDVIAYILHAADADEHANAQDELASGELSFEGERGAGDDIAQDDYYSELIERYTP